MPQPSLSTYHPSLGERLQQGFAGLLGKVGVDPRYANHLGGRIFNALNELTPVGAATAGDQAVRDFKHGHYGAAAGNGLLAGISAFPTAGKGAGLAKAMFLGVAAKNADKIALKKAQGMFASHAPREKILKDTGWFKGADDKWRFEVPDNNLATNMAGMRDPDVTTRAAVNRYMQKHYGVDDFLKLPVGSPRRNEANSLYTGWRKTAMLDTQPLSDVIRHPQLEANYDLSGVQIAPATVGGYNGNWHGGAQTLHIRPGLAAEKSNSIAAHELQHLVQGREGFATGGNIEEFELLPAQEANAALVLRQFVERAGGPDNFEAGVHAYKSALGKEPSGIAISAARQYEPADLQTFSDPLASYRRLAGEVEARNVEARLGLTAAQRRATPPWETQDTPNEWQIVRFGQ